MIKEKPTTFQLAQLAAQAAPPNAKPKDAVRRAMALWGEAEMEIAEHDKRMEYLRSLFGPLGEKYIPIFADTPKDWQARLKAYPGDERDVDRALWSHEFPVEEVEKRLFRDKNITRNSRHTLFLGLAKACIHFDMDGPLIPYGGRLDYLAAGEFIAPQPGFPIHPKNLALAEANHNGRREMMIPSREVRFVEETQAWLSKPKLHAHLVRWVVEVRQKQLAVAKARIIPASLRTQQSDRDTDENIQFKRAFRR